MVPTKLVKNWQAKCRKLLDIDDPKLNLKVYIGYKNAIIDGRIRTSEEKKMMTPREIQPTTNVSRYLIITLLTS